MKSKDEKESKNKVMGVQIDSKSTKGNERIVVKVKTSYI